MTRWFGAVGIRNNAEMLPLSLSHMQCCAEVLAWAEKRQMFVGGVLTVRMW